MASQQQPWKRWLNFIIKLFKWLMRNLWEGLKLILKALGKLKFVVEYLGQRRSVVFALLLLILFGGTALATLIPSQHKFEGNLLVQELSFTSNQPNQLFLNSIRGINQLVCEGKQTLVLTGSFQSETEPKLNQVNILEIELSSPRSQLSITSTNPEVSSEIELIELRLQEPTTIEKLSYNSFGKRLAFSLQPVNSPDQKTTPNSLELYLGEQPLKLILEGYRLPQFGLEDSPDAPNPLEITFQPDIKNLKLTLAGLTNLSINLPNPKTVDSTRWFWGNLRVEDMKFEDVQRTGVDISDEIYNSTILKGEIRMAGQDLAIKANQFLMIKQPGIQKLRHLQIQDQEGLEVRFAGETKLIQVGLDPNFPISKIQSNFLTRFFPNDVVIAIISFCSAMVAALLSWLVDNFFKTP